ncbi:hypothetical protein IFVP22_C1210002 [Vibrio parahaemolyticus]
MVLVFKCYAEIWLLRASPLNWALERLIDNTCLVVYFVGIKT